MVIPSGDVFCFYLIDFDLTYACIISVIKPRLNFDIPSKMQKLSVNIVSSGLSISRILAAAVGSASYAA